MKTARQNWMTVEFTLVYRWHSMPPDCRAYGQNPNVHAMNNEMIIRKGLGFIWVKVVQPAAQLSLFNVWFPDSKLSWSSIRLGPRQKIKKI